LYDESNKKFAELRKKQNLTLLYGAENEQVNHAVVLEKVRHQMK